MKQTDNAPQAVLFDFDGVVMDTEGQYSIFWQEKGKTYLGMDDLHLRIKGQTLDNIFRTYFDGKPDLQADLTRQLDLFERQMKFEFIPGFLDFLADLKRHGVRTAVVTSSSREKMAMVYQAHPDLPQWFDAILTAEQFAASKPDPDCFLCGMRQLGSTPSTTYVFEDSFNGLRAGLASEATVIALATTNPRAEVAPLSHAVIDNFVGFSYNMMCEVTK